MSSLRCSTVFIYFFSSSGSVIFFVSIRSSSYFIRIFLLYDAYSSIPFTFIVIGSDERSSSNICEHLDEDNIIIKRMYSTIKILSISSQLWKKQRVYEVTATSDIYTMMNERTREHIETAEAILSELDFYYEDQNPASLEEPVGFIPQNQKIKFKTVFECIEKALTNMYTQEPDVRSQIGQHLLTISNLKGACMEVNPQYQVMYNFYMNQLKPIVQQVINFCEDNHTELPGVKYAAETVDADSVTDTKTNVLE